MVFSSLRFSVLLTLFSLKSSIDVPPSVFWCSHKCYPCGVVLTVLFAVFSHTVLLRDLFSALTPFSHSLLTSVGHLDCTIDGFYISSLNVYVLLTLLPTERHAFGFSPQRTFVFSDDILHILEGISLSYLP